MASIMKSLIDNDERYVKAFKLFLDRSTQHQSMTNFIHGTVSDILERLY